MRRIGVLIAFSGNDEFWREYIAAFKAKLQALGWTEGRNVRFEGRRVEEPERLRAAADELIALSPDVIFVTTNPAAAVLTKATRTIPIVFASVSDSVGSGFVASIAHPGGNVTGFHNFEPSIAAKWLEVLKQMAPGVRRVAVLYDPQIAANVAFLNVAQQMSLAQGVTVSAARVHDGAEMEPALTSFGKEPNGGLIVAPNPINSLKRDLVIGLAARFKLPAIYPFRFYPDSGGLASYGFDRMQQVREAASYVDRILRGAKPGDLPVQLPTKFEFVINLKTAKSLGLAIPQSLLVRADEVIQ
jgi:putative ABC transport system substrate-binding protein